VFCLLRIQPTWPLASDLRNGVTFALGHLPIPIRSLQFRVLRFGFFQDRAAKPQPKYQNLIYGSNRFGAESLQRRLVGSNTIPGRDCSLKGPRQSNFVDKNEFVHGRLGTVQKSEKAQAAGTLGLTAPFLQKSSEAPCSR
jgi:hypothetical protein